MARRTPSQLSREEIAFALFQWAKTSEGERRGMAENFLLATITGLDASSIALLNTIPPHKSYTDRSSAPLRWLKDARLRMFGDEKNPEKIKPARMVTERTAHRDIRIAAGALLHQLLDGEMKRNLAKIEKKTNESHRANAKKKLESRHYILHCMADELEGMKSIALPTEK